MALWAKVTLIGFAIAVGAAALAVWVGARRHERASSQLVESLISESSLANRAAVKLDEFDNLPAPTRRYFRRVLRNGQAPSALLA